MSLLLVVNHEWERLLFMETPMMFIINGRKYRLVTGDNITGRQYKMMLATLEEVLPFINALMDGGDDSQDLGWTAIQ
ncbi:MAG: hypothetical protein JNN25_15465, partial [Candidatus Kapabacteria bacterium]|nr:hypothetical protein [Candidatus Kapabacteria bacterium]